MEKEFNNQQYLSSRSNQGLSRCPVLKILRTNEIGMVVESNRSFDIGHEMTIGFHVSNEFISAESLVVGSERQMSGRGDFRHRVTLLFSNVDAADRERLMALSNLLPAKFRSRSRGLN